MNAGYVFVATDEQVVAISKSDCTQRVMFEGSTPFMAATDTALYVVVAPTVDAPCSALHELPVDDPTLGTDIDLSGLVPPACLIGPLAASPTSLFVVGFRDDLGSSPVLVEIPCCARTPRVVGSILPDFQLRGSWHRFDWHQGTLAYAQTEYVLDFGPMTQLTTIDVATATATSAFAGARTEAGVLGYDGALYAAVGETIFAMSYPGCEARELIAPRGGDITALLPADGWLYWGEGYAQLPPALFRAPIAGGSIQPLGGTAGAALGLWVDSGFVYYTAYTGSGASLALLRVPLPDAGLSSAPSP